MKIEALLDSYKALPAEAIAHLQETLVGSLFMHRKFKQAFTRLLQIIELAKPGQVVVLYGPTNVGKTKLVKTMDKYLIAGAQRDGIPLWGSSYCRLPSPVRARFDDGETYRRTLCALEEPLIEMKVEYPDIRKGAVAKRSVPQSRRPPTHAALWQALVSRISAGHPAVFFDEAGELPQSLKVVSLRETVNLFKQLADAGGSCAVLVSGPEIAPILWESGQVAARIKSVGADPYYVAIKADRTSFCALLKLVEEKLGAAYIKPGTLCAANAVNVMEEVRGTFGIALDIIVDAAHCSLLSGNGPLEWHALRMAVDERMNGPDGIRTTIDQELALWEAAKDESKRGRYWGISAAAGFYGNDSILPTKDRVVKQEFPTTSKPKGDSKSKSDSDEVRILTPDEKVALERTPKKRGMRPNTPKRVPLGSFKEESAGGEEVSERAKEVSADSVE